MTTVVKKSNYNKHIKPIASLFKVTGWLFVLMFLPQFILVFVFSIFLGIQQGEDLSTEVVGAWFSSVSTQLSISLVTPLILVPLLVKATNLTGWNNRLAFWAVYPITRKDIKKWISIGLIYCFFSLMLVELLNLPTEQFMSDLKNASNSLPVLVLVLITICLVIPVMEELIFRGWLYSKIAESKLGHIGALIITSIIFTAIHTQYDNAVTLASIFTFGLLLGFVRYKTSNISYTVAIHIIYNSMGMIALFSFEL
jgi:membrane protease YdiL (CAAX protease family)